MKKKLTGILLLLLFIALPLQGQAKVKAPKKQCHAYVVMDAGSGEVLFGQDANKKIYPASTAKLMTAIVCVEKGNVNSVIKTKSDVVYRTTPGTYSLGIGAGVNYTFKDLLHMSLMSSAADATDSLAVGVFGSKKACVEAMNEKCKELGLKKTHFDNPVGSDIGAGYNETYASAKEMAKICRYAMAIPLIRSAVSKAHYSTQKGGMYVNTTNWFLKGMAYYDRDTYKIIGSKSGTTNAAGHVFIATAADYEGHELICAYFGNVSKESTFASIRSLFDYAFNNYKKGKLTLTPSNYDVRSSQKYGAVYSEYSALHCYPAQKDGLFAPNKVITRKQLGTMLEAIDSLKDNATLSAFVSENENGTVTTTRFAQLLQELYPVTISDKKAEEVLASCSSIDTMDETAKEAYASFASGALAVDDSCKTANQRITRGQALLIADKLADYQMNYLADHAQTQIAEVRQIPGKDGTITLPAMSYTTFNKKWSDSLKEQKEAQDAEAAAKKAEAANEAKTEFLQRMSHDIRTPINGICGMINVADHYADNMEKQTECRAKIKKTSHLLLELINEVLDMSKLESDEVVLEDIPFNLNSIFEEILGVIEHMAAEQNIRIIWEEKEVTHWNLIGSPVHVKRILMNILSNAVKYNKENGYVYIGCREIPSKQTAMTTLEFVCRDTGIGMTEAFQKRIFEPFAQEHAGSRTKFAGTGLGMPITKKLVEKMGGTISFESKEGTGTTFVIRIPFQIDADMKDRTETEEKTETSIQGLHVLLAEDNELNMEIAEFVLQNEGAVVTKAWNGQKAVDIFRKSSPGEFDVILMDIMMPVMNGYEAAKMIRSLDREDAKVIPIIAMTANAFTEDKMRAKEAGMDEHIAKPVDGKLLVKVINELVKRDQREKL
mgnify:FL=1